MAIEQAVDVLVGRLRGVVLARLYLMLDYDCPRELLDRAVKITPGLESPTVSPLMDPGWVAVRSMVPRKQVNQIMDELAELGAKAVARHGHTHLPPVATAAVELRRPG